MYAINLQSDKQKQNSLEVELHLTAKVFELERGTKATNERVQTF